MGGKGRTKHNTQPVEQKGNDFRTEVKAIAREDHGFFAIVEVAKKIKYKHEGVSCLDHPVFTIWINVRESNLPLPASVHNPIFLFKRTDSHVDVNGVPVDKNDEYVGCATPEQYFTLPDVMNTINKDKIIEDESIDKDDVKARIESRHIGDYYLTSAFLKTFESAEMADVFITKVLEDSQMFITALMKHIEAHREFVMWGGYEHNGITRNGVKNVRLVEGDFTVASFTEGNVKSHG